MSRYNIEPKKAHETVSGGITFEVLDSIKSEQFDEFALAWSEGREPGIWREVCLPIS
jgi:hypothetical protein